MAIGHDLEPSRISEDTPVDASVSARHATAARRLASSPSGGHIDIDLPALPEVGDAVEGSPFDARVGDSAHAWEDQIEVYVHEALALGDDPAAALIHLEIGRINEEHLGRLDAAADSYRRARDLSPREPSILHACRRLFAVSGQWSKLADILRDEVNAADAPERKATFLAELGGVLEDKLEDDVGALAAYREAIRCWPAEPMAISALERLFSSQERYDELYRIYEGALAVVVDSDRRLPLSLSAAQLAEDRLDTVERAIDHYREVSRLDPRNEIALAALRRLTHRSERWEEFVEVLLQSAELADAADVRSSYLLTASRIQNERLDQPDRALRSLLRALESTPADSSILRDIETLYDRNHRFEDVAKVLSRELDTSTDERERVRILFKLGAVLEEHLGRSDEALAAYRETVRLMPTQVPARQALGRLYGRKGRWSELAELFEMEIRLEDDELGRVTRLYKLAELLDARLDDDTKAIETLRQLLGIRSDYQPARKYLERLLQRRQDWPALVRLYEEEVEFTRDPEQKVFLLSRIGFWSEDKTNDLETAQAAYQHILDLVPAHLGAIRALARLATQREDWGEVLKMYELEAECTEDQRELVAILHRIGVLNEERARDVDAAMESFEKALALNPTYLPALRSLGRIYAGRHRWDDLVAMFERELEVTQAAEQRVALLFRIADVYLNNAKQDERAVQALERVLAIDDQSLPALRLLAEIHERNQDGERLAEILLRESETLADPREKAAAMMRVAELYEERLERPDRAAQIHEQLLDSGSALDPSIRALVRLYSAQGAWSALDRALASAVKHARDDAAKAAILLRRAEVAADRLRDLDAAVGHLEAAARLQPQHRAILARLERAALARGDRARALQVAEQLASTETDPRQFAARHVQIAAIKEASEPPRSGAENYRRALERVPDHPVALRKLELAYLEARNWKGLATLFHREALLTAGPTARALLFCRAAEIAEEQLNDFNFAISMFDLALSEKADFLPALRGRRRLAERLDDSETVLRCVQAEGRATVDSAHARDLLFEAGQLHQDRFGNIDAAIEAYEGVLERAPAHEPSFRRLEAIYEERDELVHLARLYERRAAALDDADARAALLFQAGRVAQDRLDDLERAISLYRRVLQATPRHSQALQRLGPIHFSRGEWDEAAEAFHETLSVSEDADAKLSALKSLGIIYQEHRQDLVKAVQSFHAALRSDPRDVDCLRRLGAVYKEACDWGSAVNVFLRLAEATPDLREKVGSLLQLGELYEQGTREPEFAITAYRKVLEIEPGNQVAIVRLLELYEAKEDWSSLAETTSAYVTTLAPDEKHKAAPLHLKVADVYESRLKDDEGAIAALRAALEVAPTEVKALERLAALYEKRVETYPRAIETHRRLLAQYPFRTASQRRMFVMYEELKEYDKAFVLAEMLVFLRAANQDEEYFYELHKSKVAPRADGRLPTRDHAQWVVHPGERGPVREVFEVLAAELGRAFPGDLSPYDLNPRTDRHGPKSDHPVRKLADELAEVLNAPGFDLWTSQKAGLDLFLENERPPALVVGAQLGRRLQDADQRFLVARQLERLKGGHHVLAQLDPRQIEALLWSVGTMANPNLQGSVDPASADQMQRALRGISSRARKSLEEVAERLVRAPVDVARHLAAAEHTANRAGLVFTNDIAVAVRNIAKRYPNVRPVFRDAAGAEETVGQIPEVRELLAFAGSEEYFATRARLGFSIQA